MKKLLTILSIGILVASCGGNQDVEAASEYCACFENSEESADAAGEAESFQEMMDAVKIRTEEITACMTAWQTKFKGKITKEGFKAELKKKDAALYEEAEKQGVFNF